MCDIDPSCLVLECITRMCSSILNTFSHCIYSGADFHIRNLMRYWVYTVEVMKNFIFIDKNHICGKRHGNFGDLEL